MSEQSGDLSELAINAINFLQAFNLDSETNDTDFNLDLALKKFDNFLEASLERMRDQNCILLFSGGLDSSILAFELNQLQITYQPVLVAKTDEIDYKNAMLVAGLLNLDLYIIELSATILEDIIPKIMRIIETTEEQQINISVPFYLAIEYLQNHEIPIAILGQGADELFCGYHRYVDYLRENPANFKAYHLDDVKKSSILNFARDNALFSSKNIIAFLPYLDQEIIKLAFSVPNDVLIPPGTEAIVKKNFLRLYAKMLGMDEQIIQMKKTAIQFGSGSYRLLRKLAIEQGFTKEFALKYGYNDNTQLYLDYLAQISNIKDFNLNIERE